MRMEAKQHRQDEGGSAKAVRLCQSGNADAAGIWDWVREEAERVAIDEPQLRPLLQDVVLSQPCLGASLGVRLARKLAREEYGRELQIWGHGYVVQGETEREAKDYFDEYVHRKGDWVAATNLVETMGLNTPRPPELLKALKMHFIGGWGGHPLIGNREQIVDGFVKLSEIGLDGVVVSWPRYIDDMRWFQREIHPLMQQAGLR